MNNALAVIPQQQVERFTLPEIDRMSIAFAKSGMFGVRDQAGAFVLMMLADLLGMHPASAFLDFDLIKGKPVKKAEAMMRDFQRVGGKVDWITLDDECAKARFTAPGGVAVVIDWTMARAHKAGLAQKDVWKQYPRAMLRSRVISEGVKTVYPAATGGMISPEEIDDLGHDEGPSPIRKTRGADAALEQHFDVKDVTPEAEAAKEPTPKEKNRIAAEGWLMSFESDLGRVASHDDLETYLKKIKAGLTKLGKEHSDLKAKADTLVAETQARLAGPDEVEEPPEEQVEEQVDRQLDETFDPETGEVLGDNDDYNVMTLARAQGIIDLAELAVDKQARYRELKTQLDASDGAELELYVNTQLDAMRGQRR